MYRAILACTLLLGSVAAQDNKAAPGPQSSAPHAEPPASDAAATPQKTTPIAVTRAQRLNAAKTVFIKKVEGSEIPVDVMTSHFEGWGRYTLVSTPDKADLLVEITSPPEQPSSVTINGSRTNPLTGLGDTTSSTTRNISNVPIRMSVLDAKTRLPLWTATEQPRHALKQKAREDNLVEATQSLFSKFHAVVEPTQP